MRDGPVGHRAIRNCPLYYEILDLVLDLVGSYRYVCIHWRHIDLVVGTKYRYLLDLVLASTIDLVLASKPPVVRTGT